MRWLIWLLLPALAGARYIDLVPTGAHTIIDAQTNPTIFTGTGGAVASNTVNVYQGTQSVRLAVAATTVFFQWTISPAKSICSDSTFGVTFYMNSKANTTNNGGFALYLGTNTSNYWTYDFGFAARDTNLTYYGNGFVTYTIIKRKMTAVGSPTCGNIATAIITLKGQTATVDTVSIGGIIGYPSPLTKAVAMIGIDDGWKSFADSGGYRAMDSIGFHYGLFINPGLLDQPNKMTTVAIDSIHSNFPGVDFYPHWWTHDTLYTLTADSITRGLSRSASWITARGMRGARITAIPFGDVSQRRFVDSTIRFCGLVDFCRVTQGNTLGEAPPYSNPFAVRAVFGLGSGITEAQAETVVNDCIASKTAMIIYGHKLGATAVDGNTWPAADWRIFVTFLKGKVNAGTLDVKSMTEYLTFIGASSGNGISNSLRIGL